MKTRGFEIVSTYSDIQLPTRSTTNSAGYDFYTPNTVIIPSHLKDFKACTATYELFKPVIVKPFCIKTGIKAYMQQDEVLQIYMRSSSPSKLGLVLANNVGIIDSDYYNNSDNEGEIGFLVYNLTAHPVKLEKGMKFGQGIFINYLKTDNDNTENERIGGFGSTGI